MSCCCYGTFCSCKLEKMCTISFMISVLEQVIGRFFGYGTESFDGEGLPLFKFFFFSSSGMESV